MLCNLAEEVVSGVATVDAMVAIGVGQFTEILVGLNECFCVFRRIAEVNVVVGKTMNKQQFAAEFRCTANGTHVVAISILARSTHEALGVDAVVVAPTGGSRHSNSCCEDRTPFAHAHQGVEAAIAPAPNGDAVLVNIALLAKPDGSLHLVVTLQLTKLEVGTLFEVPTPSACATSIHTNADEALLSQILLVEATAHVAGVPTIDHLLAARTTILVHHDGVLLTRVEISRQYHESVKLDAVCGRKGEEFTLT